MNVANIVFSWDLELTNDDFFSLNGPHDDIRPNETHEMDHWHIVGLCEVRWKNFGATFTHEGHKFYFSGMEGMDLANTDMSIHPITSRFITIRLRLRATPFQYHNHPGIWPNI
jgi:hypothetical protein